MKKRPGIIRIKVTKKARKRFQKMRKRMDRAVDELTRDILAGTFRPETYTDEEWPELLADADLPGQS
jgi:hypothetical protein